MHLESLKNDQETSVAGMKEVTEGFVGDHVREVRGVADSEGLAGYPKDF